MFAVTFLGYLAAAVSTASFLPQAWKIIKSRQTKDISFGMYLLTVAAFWSMANVRHLGAAMAAGRIE